MSRPSWVAAIAFGRASQFYHLRPTKRAVRRMQPMPETSHVKVRLIHDGVQPGAPVPERVNFGIQDKKSAVQSGKPSKGGLLLFEIDIAVKTSSSSPVLSGPFVHGPPPGRFLYLS